MKIYTRAGDKGTTGLFGGDRVSKAAARLHAYGTIDELNSLLGVILSRHDLPQSIREELDDIQHTLFLVGSDLATPLKEPVNVPRMGLEKVADMERWIDLHTKNLPELTTFILPGGSESASLLHNARTVCRRAERWIVDLMQDEDVNTALIVYVNRLSDYLFTVARAVNQFLDFPDRTIRVRTEASRGMQNSKKQTVQREEAEVQQ
jgi:cob(I)alamin adenosyltransferase